MRFRRFLLPRFFGRVLCALLLATSPAGGLPMAAAAPAAPPALPPPPDSLRAALAAAPAGPARVAALLRVAAAFNSTLDSALVPYTQAAEREARRLADSVGVGRALDARGYYYLWTQELTRAAPVLRRAETCLAAAPPAPRAANLYHLGMLYGDQRRGARALAYYRRAYALYAAVGDADQQAEVLNSAGLTYLYQGRYDSAARYLFRAVRQHHRRGKAVSEAAALGNLALLYIKQQQFATAARYARAGFALESAAHDTVAMVESLDYLGHIALRRDSLTAALRYYRQSYRGRQRLGATGRLGSSSYHLATVFERLGPADSAGHYFRQALRQTRRHPSTFDVTQLLRDLGAFHLRRGELTTARRWADSARAQSPQAPDTYDLLSEIAARQRDYARAYALRTRGQELRAAQQARENQRTTEELRVSYEAEQTEQQLRLTQAAGEVAHLRRQRERLATGLAGLLLLVAAAAATAFYRRRQRRHLEALRTQLAADLHDDVGALLTQISVESQLLRAGVYPAAEQLTHLDQLAETSRAAVRQMSDVVWSVDARNDSAGHLADRLRDYAHEVLPAAGLDVEFFIETPALPAAPLPAPVRQQLYLIYKEALHNAVKHAPPGARVQVDLRAVPEGLQLTVSNDGPPAAPGRATGHGLRNIGMRAQAVGGTAISAPRPEGGWQVVATVPVGRE